MNPEACAAVRESDVILMLDWVDPGGAFKQAFQGEVCQAKVIHVSLDMHIHRGWSMDMGSLPPSDLFMLCEPDAAVHSLLAACQARPEKTWPLKPELPPMPESDAISLRAIAQALDAAAKDTPLCVARLPLGWHGAYRNFAHPLDYLGADGGGGIGAGPGNAIGVALALRDANTDRLPVALIGDGDFLMGNTAVWTAVRYGIPVLLIHFLTMSCTKNVWPRNVIDRSKTNGSVNACLILKSTLPKWPTPWARPH
jgi:thiamine pyrophosphate-dependent acetolactate synthase large subunit-like protein